MNCQFSFKKQPFIVKIFNLIKMNNVKSLICPYLQRT